MAPGPPALPLWKRLDLNCSKAGMRLMVRVLCSCPGEEKVYTRESVFSPIAVWSAIVPVCCTALLTTSWRMWIHWYIHTQANTLLPGIRNASSTFSCSTVLFHFTLFCMEQTLHVWNLAALKLRFTKTTGLCLLFSGKENKELPSLATRWFVLVPFFEKRCLVGGVGARLSFVKKVTKSCERGQRSGRWVPQEARGRGAAAQYYLEAPGPHPSQDAGQL